MEPAWLASLRLVDGTFRGAGPRVRLHAIARFLTCPFLRALRLIPAGGRLLDIGAGHGTFALLAVENGCDQAVALEPDLRKTPAWYRHPRVRFVAGFSDAVRGPFDVVTMFDVLYRFPLESWDALFASIHDLLRPGGLAAIKDLDPEHRWKQGWNRAQEAVSDTLGLTLGSSWSYEPQARIRARLGAAGFTDVRSVALGAGYPHAHILHLAQRPS